jgi:broad specificity phosphatase PhoE
MAQKSKLIYLIRHGETAYNKLGVVQGSGIDADLNDKGREQANAFFEYYKHVNFDKIYVSALVRTHQTVSNFIEKGIKHEVLSGLNEISWGEKEGKIPTEKENNVYADLLEAWQKGNTQLAAEGGESPEEVLARQLPALSYILKQENEDTILVAMHGRAMRILLTHLTKQPLKNMDQFEHTNTCLYLISYAEGNFTLLKQNDLSHLKVEELLGI